MHIHRLEPMSPLIRGLTAVVLVLPLVLTASARFGGPAASGLRYAAAALALLYTAVWLLLRPSRLTVDDRALTIVWPRRSRSIPIASILGAAVIDQAELSRRYGRGARLGSGGLWGQFGYAWTEKAGLIDTYITTLG